MARQLKIKIIFTAFCFVLLFVLLAPHSLHAKKKKDDEEKQKIQPDKLGKIVLMIRGGDTVHVTPKPKPDLFKGASTNFALWGAAGVAIGGLTEAVIGEKTKKTKDLIEAEKKERLLKEALKGWGYQEIFKETFLSNLPENYDVNHLIICPSTEMSKSDKCTYYERRQNNYYPINTTTMTDLAQKGVQTLADLRITGALLYKSRSAPFFEAFVHFINLYGYRSGQVLGSEGVLRKGPLEMEAEFEKYLLNGAFLTKKNISQLTTQAAEKLAQKLNEKTGGVKK